MSSLTRQVSGPVYSPAIEALSEEWIETLAPNLQAVM